MSLLQKYRVTAAAQRSQQDTR